MNEVKDLFDAASSMDTVHTELSQVYDALQVLGEAINRESFRPGSKLEEWRAINFFRRSPIYLNTFIMICRDFARVLDEMQDGVNSTYAASKEAKETTV